MTEKRFTIEVLDKNNWLIEDTKTGENANPIDGTANVLKGLISTLNKFNDENEQLKKENQQYKALLQDRGLLISDEDVMCIRKDIAEQFIKPICKENGFDVDVDCTNGFTIIPKGDYK